MEYPAGLKYPWNIPLLGSLCCYMQYRSDCTYIIHWSFVISTQLVLKTLDCHCPLISSQLAAANMERRPAQPSPAQPSQAQPSPAELSLVKSGPAQPTKQQNIGRKNGRKRPWWSEVKISSFELHLMRNSRQLGYGTMQSISFQFP